MDTLVQNRNTTLWGIGSTLSFRLASKQFKFRGFLPFGSNLQNQPDELRRIYIPSRPDFILVQCDQAGAEALIVAFLCPHGSYRELFLQNIKPHTYVAMHIFKDKWAKEGFEDVEIFCKLPIRDLKVKGGERFKQLCEHIKKDYECYYIGKKTVHSFSYRMRPNTFIMDVLKESEGKVSLTKSQAEYFYYTFHLLFPEIQGSFYKTIDEELRRTRTLRNLFGYPRYFGGVFSESFFREATSFIPQSTVGCITNRAFVNMQALIEHEELEWNLLNNCHDSILLECPIEESIHAARVLSDMLNQDLVSPRGEKFKMKSEASVGMNWGKWHETENPEGMREIKL